MMNVGRYCCLRVVHTFVTMFVHSYYKLLGYFIYVVNDARSLKQKHGSL